MAWIANWMSNQLGLDLPKKNFLKGHPLDLPRRGCWLDTPSKSCRLPTSAFSRPGTLSITCLLNLPLGFWDLGWLFLSPFLLGWLGSFGPLWLFLCCLHLLLFLAWRGGCRGQSWFFSCIFRLLLLYHRLTFFFLFFFTFTFFPIFTLDPWIVTLLFFFFFCCLTLTLSLGFGLSPAFSPAFSPAPSPGSALTWLRFPSLSAFFSS